MLIFKVFIIINVLKYFLNFLKFIFNINILKYKKIIDFF